MQKLIFKNPKGKEIDLTSEAFGIINWNGLSESDLNIQSQQVPFQDGSIYIDSLIQEREINVTLAINDDGDLKKRYELKRELISILNPRLGESILIYSNDILSKQIKCVPRLPKFSNKNANDSGTLKCNLSFFCNSPYWEDLEETIVSFDLINSTEVEVLGDVESPVEIELFTPKVTNPQIKNITTGKSIKYNGELNTNLRINTNFGKKSIVDEKINFEMFAISENITQLIEDSEYVYLNNKVKTKDCIKFNSTIDIPKGKFSAYSPKLNKIISDDVFVYWSDLSECFYKINPSNTSGSNNGLLKSIDGINWTELKFGVEPSKISYRKENCIVDLKVDNVIRLIVTGQEGLIYSDDGGKTWNIQKLDSINEFYKVIKVKHNNTLNALYYSNGSYTVGLSIDGLTWQYFYTAKRQVDIVDICYCEPLKQVAFIYNNYSTSTYSSGITIRDSLGKFYHKDGFRINETFRLVFYSKILGKYLIGGNSGLLLMSEGEFDFSKGTSVQFNNVFSNLPNTKVLLNPITNKYFAFRILDSYYTTVNFLTSSDGVNWVSEKQIKNTVSSNGEYAVDSEGCYLVKIYSNGWYLYKYDSNFNLLGSLYTFTSSELETLPDCKIKHLNDLNKTLFLGDYKLNIIEDGSETVESISLDFTPNDFCYINEYTSLGILGEKYIFCCNDGLIKYSSNLTTFTSKDTECGSNLNFIYYCKELNELIAIGNEKIIRTNDFSTFEIFDTPEIIKQSSYFNIYYSKYYQKYLISGYDKVLTNRNVILTTTDFENYELLAHSSMDSVFDKDGQIKIFGDLYLDSFINLEGNRIQNLSQDSDINFNLIPGKNKLQLTYDSGNANAVLRFKNKYLGV